MVGPIVSRAAKLSKSTAKEFQDGRGKAPWVQNGLGLAKHAEDTETLVE